MIAALLCVLALVVTFWAGRRSLGAGLIALIAVGYFYGILRANLLTVYSHFIFDAGMLGLYLSQKWTSSDPAEAKRLATLRAWLAAMMIWPCLLVLMPFQPLLVSLVGLRGNIFFIPVALLGARLRTKDLHTIACGLAILNLLALGFGGAEYFLGVPRFYPMSPVTTIIYISGDVAGGFFRIPAIFANAHSYGGSMVASMPFLIGLWTTAQSRKVRVLALAGTVAAMLGILMSAARQDFVFGSVMILVTMFSVKMKTGARVAFVSLLVVIGFVTMSNTRLQRFTSLKNTDYVQDRIAGSVNRGFFEILFEYPMGNGLGGGGTSMPYFLQGEVRNPIGMENEYARILAEQGIVGLLIWLGFVAWLLSRVRSAFGLHPWANTRKMAWCLAVVWLATSWIGIGVLTSIPNTVMLFLAIGWTATQWVPERSRVMATDPRRTYRPAYAR